MLKLTHTNSHKQEQLPWIPASEPINRAQPKPIQSICSTTHLPIVPSKLSRFLVRVRERESGMAMRRSVLRLSSLAERALRPVSSSSRVPYSSDQAASSNSNDYLLGTLPETMKAAVLWEPRKPMTIEDLKMPRPQVGEVLIRTKACGVCHSDLHVINKDQPYPIPCVLGHEVTGEVVEHGKHTDSATVKRLPVGSRVVGSFIMPCGGCFFCVRGQEDLCESFFKYNRGMGGLYDGTTRLYMSTSGDPVYMYSMGGLAEYCVVPANGLAVIPESLPYSESAIIGCAVFTAYGAMKNAADMRAGETVAIIGTGGVGSSCVQVARAFGGRIVIGVDISDKKLEMAKQMGATHTINASTEDVPQRVRDITGGRGVDIAVEALGKPSTFNQAVMSVRDGGRAVMIGLAPFGTTTDVEISRLVRRQIRIIGSYGARARQDLANIVGLAELGFLKIESAVTQKRKLEEADKVYSELDKGEITGRAIIELH